MSENRTMTRINSIDNATKEKIQIKSAYGLPTRPSERGMTPAEIKRAFYGPIVESSNSLVSEINRIVGETNEALGEAEKKIDEVQEYAQNIPIYRSPEDVPENPPAVYAVFDSTPLPTSEDGNTGDYFKLIVDGKIKFAFNDKSDWYVNPYLRVTDIIKIGSAVSNVQLKKSSTKGLLINDKEAATQEYVADYAVQKLENADSIGKVYMVEKNSSIPKLGRLSVTNYPNSILRRNQNSQVEVGRPTNKLHAANKEYVDSELAKFDFIKVVGTLPEREDALPNKIYFVPKDDPQNQDLFDEYIWVNKGTEEEPEWVWEWVTTKQLEVDLTPYATEEYVNEAIRQAFANIAYAEGVSF